ncbi:putative WRKY transcription factor [Quillaja saponaria]|uniref:WRKY transcription factor n=1 Tax=Quillaja saponaria TaxID=32244 RepID=A0AAD7KT45_QUISA|nr:putative WRKY transcription factor [Quillaja saponaria]
MDYSENPNIANPNYPQISVNINPSSSSKFVISDDYLMVDEFLGQDSWSESSEKAISTDIASGFSATAATSSYKNNNMQSWKRKNGVMKNKEEVCHRVAFRTKTELEVMDDGFKWRKYGKKAVKDSPNPRNYYKCSSGGCSVKKRVERDREDSSYVITAYEGVHNHESPCAVYYNQMSLMLPSHNAST